MTANARQLYEFLLADMEATASTADATALLTAAKAKILAGAGALPFTSSATLNGKSVTLDAARSLSSLDVAAAARRALDEYNDTPGTGSITFLDFAGI